jgi:hypothetical protein
MNEIKSIKYSQTPSFTGTGIPLEKFLEKVSENFEVVKNFMESSNTPKPAYTVVQSLPESIPVGQQVLYNGTMYRGLLLGESSLPVGTPWPIEGFKEYIAELSQTGEEDPVAVVLRNSVGLVLWERTDEGEYSATGPFTVDETVVTANLIPATSSVVGDIKFSVQVSNLSVNIQSTEGGEASDGLLSGMGYISIRVFPPQTAP